MKPTIHLQAQRLSLFTCAGLGSLIPRNKESASRYLHTARDPQNHGRHKAAHHAKSVVLRAGLQFSLAINAHQPHASPPCVASCTSNGAASTSKTFGNIAATPQPRYGRPASQNAANSPAKHSSRNIPSRPPDRRQTSTATSAASSHAASKTRPRRLSR